MSVVFPDFLSCHRGYPSSNNHNSISTDIFMQIEPLEKAHFLLYYDITISKCPSGAKSLTSWWRVTNISLQKVHHHPKTTLNSTKKHVIARGSPPLQGNRNSHSINNSSPGVYHLQKLYSHSANIVRRSTPLQDNTFS